MQRLKSVLKNISFNKYFFASFFILWCFYIIRFPTLSYNAEIWVEHGTNYLYHAYNSSLWTNIWMPDAGYLVWLPRLIAIFVSYVSSPYYFIYITAFIALAVIAYCIAFINHKSFRDIIESDIYRFLLSLILGFIIVPHYLNFGYNNFTYHGFIFCALIIFMDKEKLSTKEYWTYSILNALFCISKFHYMTFLPVFLGAIAIHHYRKEKRSALFYIPSIVTMLIQVLFVLLVSSKTSDYLQTKTVMNKDIASILLTGLMGAYYWLEAYSINFKFTNNIFLANMLGLSLIAGLIFVLMVKWRKRELSNKILMLVITFNILAVGYLAISALAHLGDATISFDTLLFRFSRSCFIAYVLAWIAGFILLYNLKSKIFKNILLMIFLFLSIYTTSNKIPGEANPIDIRYAYSDWENFYELFDQEQYCIPINPFPYIMSNNCSKIFEYNNISKSIKTNKIFEAGKKVLSLTVVYIHAEEVYAIAYDKNGSKIGEAKMLSNRNRFRKYLVFDKSVVPYEIIIYNKQGERITRIISAIIYG